jgi:hypothetical protein
VSGNTSIAASETHTVRALKARLPRRLHGAHGGVVRRQSVADLLAEARHHEEAVVDREPEPHAGREVEGEDRDVRERCEDREDEERPDDGDPADEQRQARRDDAAEHEHHEHEGDREGDQLGPQEVLFDLVVGLTEHLREAADPHLEQLVLAREPR